MRPYENSPHRPAEPLADTRAVGVPPKASHEPDPAGPRPPSSPRFRHPPHPSVGRSRLRHVRSLPRTVRRCPFPRPDGHRAVYPGRRSRGRADDGRGRPLSVRNSSRTPDRLPGQGGDLFGGRDLHELLRPAQPLSDARDAADDPRAQDGQDASGRRPSDDLHRIGPGHAARTGAFDHHPERGVREPDPWFRSDDGRGAAPRTLELVSGGAGSSGARVDRGRHLAGSGSRTIQRLGEHGWQGCPRRVRLHPDHALDRDRLRHAHVQRQREMGEDVFDRPGVAPIGRDRIDGVDAPDPSRRSAGRSYRPAGPCRADAPPPPAPLRRA